MMGTRPNILSLATVAAFLAGLAGMASVAEAFTISGRIVIVGGKPSAGATVWIDLLHRARTDSLGDYSLGGLWNEEYVVKVWAEHCLASIMDTVRISNGDVTGVNDTIVAADIVEDGRINLYDAGELLRHYGAVPDSASWDGALDFDGSETIDSLDMVALMSCWKDTNDVSPPSFLEVLEPDSATVWLVGQQNVPIRWKTGGLNGPVSIELLWDHDLVREITDSTPNDGSYTEYDVPLDLVPGTVYRISIHHIDSGASALSEYFEVRRSIVVTEPTSAAFWSRGEKGVPVNWMTGNLGGTVFVKLYNGGTFVFDLLAGRTANDGTALVDVPAGVPMGSNYRVQVYLDADYCDFSDYFAIGSAALVITAPDTNTAWLRGQQNAAIRWESSFMTGSVSIALYKDGSFVETIVSSTPNDGEYSEYNVPALLEPGTGYQVRIDCDDGRQTSSEHFETVKPPGWFSLYPSTGSDNLKSVCFTSASVGTAVGANGFVLRTTDGGATWTRQWAGTRKALNGVAFRDANNGIAVGDNNIILKTTDGGATWVSMKSGAARGAYYAVAYADADTVVAVGQGYAVGSTIGAILFSRSTDGAETWISSVSYGFLFPRSVTFLDARIGAAAGDVGCVYWTSDAGATWRLGGWGGDYEDISTGVSMLDASTAVVVGSDYYPDFNYGWRYRGVIQLTRDGGASWSMVDATSSLIKAVSFADANTGMAVGTGGWKARTTDGGATWTNQTPGITTALAGLSFGGAGTGTAVGDYGRIIRTADAGATWTLQTPSTAYALRDMSFTDASTGIAVGAGAILGTVDGGASWSTRLTLRETLNDVFMVNADTGTAIGEYYDCSDCQWGGTAKFYGIVLRTTDGGISWSPQANPRMMLSGLWFMDPNTGIAFGYAEDDSCAVLRTHDGGGEWSSNVIGRYHLYDLWFSDANTGTAVGAAGAILRTLDGGETWIPQTSGVTGYLLGVCFIDANTGIAVGQSGTILRTVDGGATWTHQASGTTENLRGVRFVDANTGFVAGNRGTILRTTDGGATWLKQSSGETRDLYAVQLFDAQTAIVAGQTGAILKTTTGGE